MDVSQFRNFNHKKLILRRCSTKNSYICAFIGNVGAGARSSKVGYDRLGQGVPKTARDRDDNSPNKNASFSSPVISF